MELLPQQADKSLTYTHVCNACQPKETRVLAGKMRMLGENRFWVFCLPTTSPTSPGDKK